MRSIRTIIVDDEPVARRELEFMIGDDPEVEVVATCGDGISALQRIRELRPDLLFLDIQMPRLDGFEMLEHLEANERPDVVFTTNEQQHAIRAFEFAAVDFLLKPFTEGRFLAALALAKDVHRKAQSADLTQQVDAVLRYARQLEATATQRGGLTVYTDQLVLKAEGALHFVKPSEIIWIEAQGDFVKVQTGQKTQLVRDTLQHLEQRLDPARFLRIHRSFLVNVDHISRVETALYGDYSVYMDDRTKLRLSRNYRPKLKALLNGVWLGEMATQAKE